VKAKDNFTTAVIGAIFIVAATGCLWTKHPVSGYVLGGLGFVFLFSIFSKNSDVGQCQYCMARFRETKLTVKDGLLRCDQWGEYSQVVNKTAKPLDPTTYSNAPKFESAVFKQGSMPNACASCGALATRLDTITTGSMNKTLAIAGAARLMIGAPGVAIFSSKQASIAIFYCALPLLYIRNVVRTEFIGYFHYGSQRLSR
jgi:hypothetical protein